MAEELVAKAFLEDALIFVMAMRGIPREKKYTIAPEMRTYFNTDTAKAVYFHSKSERASTIKSIENYIAEALSEKENSYNHLLFKVAEDGKKTLDCNRMGTFYSFCALIVNICLYCHEKGHLDLIDAAFIGGTTALKELNLASKASPRKYKLYAQLYNVEHERPKKLKPLT